MKGEPDYGPLAVLVGAWEGNKGLDIAPEGDGSEEHNPYYDTITYYEAGNVSNAEIQVLNAVRYHQIVKRKSNDEVFHEEIGYWLWDADRKTIIRTFTIPRAVAVVAGGDYDASKAVEGEVVLEVKAAAGSKEWDIAQSPFMKENALTTSFESKFVIKGDTLHFYEKTMLEIYGKTFEHTDENVLKRVK
jgi:hypothetical protein